MIESLIFLFITVSVSALIGFSNAMITTWLDAAMDFGKIFGNLRFKIVGKFAKKADKESIFLELAGRAKEEPSFSDRLNGMDQVYWQIAKYQPNVQKFICKPCMSTNLLLLSAIPYGILLFEFYLIKEILFILFFAFAFNQYFINK